MGLFNILNKGNREEKRIKEQENIIFPWLANSLLKSTFK